LRQQLLNFPEQQGWRLSFGDEAIDRLQQLLRNVYSAGQYDDWKRVPDPLDGTRYLAAVCLRHVVIQDHEVKGM